MSETADTVAVKIVADATTAERNILAYGSSVHRTMTSVEVSVTQGAETAEAAAKRQQAAYRDIGTSIVKIAADARDGKNAFQIFGEQGTTLAASLVGVGGTVGRVAGYLTGPWGVALTTAASLIGMFVTESDKATDASRRQGDAARNLRDAMDDLASVTGEANRTQGEITRTAEGTTRELLSQEIKKRDEVIKKLANAEKQLEAALSAASAFSPDGGAGAVTVATRRVKALKEQQLALNKTVADASRQVRATEGGRIRRKVAGDRDPVVAANNSFEDDHDALKARHLRREIDGDAYETGLKRLETTRDTAIKAAARGGAKPTAAPVVVTAAPSFEEYRPEAGVVTPAAKAAVEGPKDEPAAIEVPVRIATTKGEVDAELAKLVAGLPKLELVDAKQLEKIGKIAATLQEDLVQGLTDAIVSGKSLGDVLVDSFARAGVALLKSQIMKMFDPTGDGKTGFAAEVTGLLGGLFAKPPGRASGGHVSAGQLYRVNEGGVEGFRPAGSGTIVPLGRMAAARSGGGVTVVQPLNVSFAGAITTPELMAQFKAYADGVGQAAVLGGAAMAQARMNRRAARSLAR
ncbi:hypothetical protein ACFOMD_01675 [Sphingoaurantiacus capsulatus]|uniref:Uncharacterized protein n=1 Tax=Sphingoaurantiacus capsulatus TaxID=1771310 RepID=A0ABV7X760_9SPHN